MMTPTVCGVRSVIRTLIGRDRRDVRVDPEPAVAPEHLHIEMEVTRGAVRMVLRRTESTKPANEGRTGIESAGQPS
jgi:hypothetical protein